MHGHRLIIHSLAYSMGSAFLGAGGRALAWGDGYTPVNGPTTSPVAWAPGVRSLSFSTSYRGQAAPPSPRCAGSGAEPQLVRGYHG